MNGSNAQRFHTMTVSLVYPLYLAKIEKKGRTKAELDTVIRWLTGYDQSALDQRLAAGTTFEGFFAEARLHPNASLIRGVICGVRIEEIEDPRCSRSATSTSLWMSWRRGARWRRSCGTDLPRAAMLLTSCGWSSTEPRPQPVRSPRGRY